MTLIKVKHLHTSFLPAVLFRPVEYCALSWGDWEISGVHVPTFSQTGPQKLSLFVNCDFTLVNPQCVIRSVLCRNYFPDDTLSTEKCTFAWTRGSCSLFKSLMASSLARVRCKLARLREENNDFKNLSFLQETAHRKCTN